MGLEEAVEYALSEEEPSATQPSSTTGQASLSSTPEHPAGLTSREGEVLGLVAEGLSNAQGTQRQEEEHEPPTLVAVPDQQPPAPDEPSERLSRRWRFPSVEG
jgi:hypothetical protein